MRLLQIENFGTLKLVAIFGEGLIGSEICQQILKRFDASDCFFTFSWNKVELQNIQLVQIGEYISKTFGDYDDIELSIVWSAGSISFDAKESEFCSVLSSYINVLFFFQKLSRDVRFKVSFHLLSSIGGLYEGAGYINSSTSKFPLRAYGRYKITEEYLLQECVDFNSKIIYRLSSVYGLPKEGQRKGLIPTLVYNNLYNKSTSIYGNLSTIRDYVYNRDVANFIISQFVNGLDINETFYLASFKPTTIYEVNSILERITKKKSKIIFSSGITNGQNISLNPNLRPTGFRVTPFLSTFSEIYRYCIKARMQ